MKEIEPGTFWHFLNQLSRSPEEGKIAGICSGFAKASPVPAWIWRALFLIGIFCGGIGIAAYVILWIVMPVERLQQQDNGKRGEP